MADVLVACWTAAHVMMAVSKLPAVMVAAATAADDLMASSKGHSLMEALAGDEGMVLQTAKAAAKALALSMAWSRCLESCA